MSGLIGVVFEGERREPLYWRSIENCFFAAEKVKPIPLSAGENLYMLWKQLVEDDFETDVLEIVRDYSERARIALKGLSRQDFQEVYLFFDLDIHNNNLGKRDERKPLDVIDDMLHTFDNETENGKLYISYPMSEALRDVREDSCKAFYRCLYPIQELSDYKNKSGINNPVANQNKYTRNQWEQLLMIFLCRCRCLFEDNLDCDDLLEWYKSTVSSNTIFQQEKSIILHLDKIFVLSAFPEFLLDYFRADYWKAMTLKSVTNQGCCPEYRNEVRLAR